MNEAERIAAYADVPIELARLVVEGASEHNIDVRSIRSNCKFDHFVACRRDIARRAKRLGYSYPTIGRAINRDHTTVIHLVKFTPLLVAA